MNDDAVVKKVSDSLKDQKLDGFMGECVIKPKAISLKQSDVNNQK